MNSSSLKPNFLAVFINSFILVNFKSGLFLIYILNRSQYTHPPSKWTDLLTVDFGNNDIEKHFKISQAQLNNIFQQMDVGTYENFNDMYFGFNTEVGTRDEINITKGKYKRVILLLLAYKNDLIDFS